MGHKFDMKTNVLLEYLNKQDPAYTLLFRQQVV